MKYFILIVILSLVQSCKLTQDVNSGLLLNENSECDFMIKRKTVNKVHDTGTIMNLSGDFLIKSNTSRFRYYACNLPESIKNVQTKVVFKGKNKKIFSNEKVIGKFLILTYIDTLN